MLYVSTGQLSDCGGCGGKSRSCGIRHVNYNFGDNELELIRNGAASPSGVLAVGTYELI